MQTTSAPAAHYAVKLRNDEVIGLAIAIAAHVAIAAALAISALRAPAVIPPSERVTVSLAEDVGLDATAAQISDEGQASVADRIGEVPVPPKPVEKPAPPKVVEKPKVAKKPVVSMDASSVRKKPTPVATPKNAGASRLGDDFKKGLGAKVDANAPIPASQVGSSDKASIQQALSRQLARYWQPPSGADANDLVTIIAFDLNPDGSLAGDPRVVSQSGVTDSNKAQAGRHAELAIRAVRRAAPFDLPPKFYNVWKKIRTSRFDWELAQ
jgi:hypothetical protein